MKALVQRSKKSSVSVDKTIVGQIAYGLVVLVSYTLGDSEEQIDYLVKKILNLRIFDDENNVMNKSILDVKGSILLISQFTLYAETANGNRPSYKKALPSDLARPLYELTIKKLQEHVPVATGIFGADMQVNILNDGPVTIMIEK